MEASLSGTEGKSPAPSCRTVDRWCPGVLPPWSHGALYSGRRARIGVSKGCTGLWSGVLPGCCAARAVGAVGPRVHPGSRSGPPLSGFQRGQPTETRGASRRPFNDTIPSVRPCQPSRTRTHGPTKPVGRAPPVPSAAPPVSPRGGRALRGSQRSRLDGCVGGLAMTSPWARSIARFAGKERAEMLSRFSAVELTRAKVLVAGPGSAAEENDRTWHSRRLSTTWGSSLR
jgi:hypothetical protein